VGLVNQIELGELNSPAILDLLRQYIPPLLAQGVDTLVLGCTHYPFVETQIRQVIEETLGQQKSIQIIDTGAAVARRLESQLGTHHLLRATSLSSAEKNLMVWATGNTETLQGALGFILAPDEMVPVLGAEV
jgi:glutamate racemase